MKQHYLEQIILLILLKIVYAAFGFMLIKTCCLDLCFISVLFKIFNPLFMNKFMVSIIVKHPVNLGCSYINISTGKAHFAENAITKNRPPLNNLEISVTLTLKVNPIVHSQRFGFYPRVK